MHRFFVPEGSPADGLVLEGREAHHATDVLRVRQGDLLVTLNGRGLVRDCSVHRLSRGRVELNLVKETRFGKSECSITLLQAIPKGKTFETIVQKATEVGAAHIVPLLTERVVVELGEDDSARKLAKWQQVAIEAAKQCGTPWLPEIHPPVHLGDYLKNERAAGLSLVACLLPHSSHARRFIQEFLKARGRQPRDVRIFIGPEGDFTPAEYALIEAHGGLPITLGPNVLRADTAAMYALAVLSYEFLASKAEPVASNS